jgi:RNA polymerase sigma-70 factor (ECF subfamily)
MRLTMADPLDEAFKDRRARFETEILPLMPAAYRFALRLTRRPEDARDIVQDAYLRAFRTFGNFRPGTNAKAWLFTILYSVFVNRWHKERRESSVSIEDLENEFPRLVAVEDPVVIRESLSSRSADWAQPEVDAALQRLPEAFRSALLLVDVEELTYEEAAAALGCPVGTLRSRLFRARKAIYVALREFAARAGYGPPRPETK